jgi:CheY-like chemotaxis protein
MPGIDGLQASRMIKQDPQVAHPPAVILVSAYRREEVLKEQTDEEIASFINKPVSQSRLYDAISEIYHTDNTIEPEASQVDALLSDRRVLLAEDNLVNQKVAVALLAKKGVDVTIANNGREVLTIMADDSAHFDAILMDIEMPEMDGFEATHAIRGGCHKPEIPIIALTAQALKGDRERCLNSGMDAYLSKPFEPKSLYSVLAQILDRSRSSSN